jgi:hypothetical protein
MSERQLDVLNQIRVGELTLKLLLVPTSLSRVRLLVPADKELNTPMLIPRLEV